MRRMSWLLLLLILFCATAVSADEEVVRLLSNRSERYMGHLDRKEFLAIREMLDPEIIKRITEDTFLKTMMAIYGQSTIFYGRPKVAITSQTSATVSVKTTYFSNDRIEVGCQQIYWVLSKGEWFISHQQAGLSGKGGCFL